MGANRLRMHPIRAEPCGEFGSVLSGKPEGNFSLGGFDRIGTVGEIFPVGQGIVASDGAGRSLPAVGRAEQGTYDLDRLFALDDHGNRGARDDEIPQRRVEVPFQVLGVMLIRELTIHLPQLHLGDTQAFGLEPAEHRTDQAPADGVWFQQHEGSLGGTR